MIDANQSRGGYPRFSHSAKSQDRSCQPWIWLAAFLALSANVFAQKAPAAKDAELEAVTALLDQAWSGEPAAAQKSKELYDSRRQRVGDRSRWHYAYGLGQLKLKRHTAAVPAFQEAIHDADSFRFAPWKALIWTELTLKKYDAALEHIQELAGQIAKAEFSGTAEEQEQIATWIGQTLAAVEKLNATPKTKAQLEKADAALAELWNDELLAAYHTGREYTDALYDELMSQVQEATKAAKSKEKKARDEEQSRLKGSVEDADEKKAELQKKAENLQKQAEQKLLQIDKQLARLERDYNYLEARALSVLQSMSIVQNELNFAQQQRSSSNTRQNPFEGGLNSQPLQRLNFLMAMYQDELNATTTRGMLVAQQAMAGLQTRNQLVQQAQSTTADLAGEHASLSKWQKRMNQQADKLEQTKLKGDSLSVRAKRARAKTLNTYLEFDPDWERILLTERSGK
jgi:hypothetical protein